MKLCTKCKTEKRFIEFHKNKKTIDGINYTCKSCVLEYQRNNKEKRYEYKKKYKENNKEKVYLMRKKYYESNKIKIANYKKDWAEKKRKSDPIFKYKNNVRDLIRKSFKRVNNEFKKSTKTELILGCSLDEFRLYIELQFKKGMTLENHGLWHLDHIIPLASAQTEDEIIKLNHYTNFQPLWAKENLSKGDKIIEKQIKLL
jgi:hypothetical protein